MAENRVKEEMSAKKGGEVLKIRYPWDDDNE